MKRNWQFFAVASSLVFVTSVISFIAVTLMGNTSSAAMVDDRVANSAKQAESSISLDTSIDEETSASVLPQEATVKDLPPERMPKHPLLGVADLRPERTLPEKAISKEDAARAFAEYTWGERSLDRWKGHNVLAGLGVYQTAASPMGPAVSERPVWVVVVEGLGPAPRCGAPIFSEKDLELLDEADCPFNRNDGVGIFDAESGRMLAGWHQGGKTQ